jgi:hypothetical protein
VTTLKRIFMLVAVVACLAAAGCGSDDEGGKQIPAEQADQLRAQLDIVQARLDNGSEGACKDILGAEDANDQAVADILSSLPNDVDPDVRDTAAQSFDNLWSLVESRCEELKPDESAQPEPTEPDTTTTETQTETTETTPPETDTEPTTPEEQPLPPDGDGENGGAVPPEGNGNGNGGGVGPGAAKEKKEKGE